MLFWKGLHPGSQPAPGNVLRIPCKTPAAPSSPVVSCGIVKNARGANVRKALPACWRFSSQVSQWSYLRIGLQSTWLLISLSHCSLIRNNAVLPSTREDSQYQGMPSTRASPPVGTANVYFPWSSWTRAWQTFSEKVPMVNIFWLCKLYGLCHNYSAWPL